MHRHILIMVEMALLQVTKHHDQVQMTIKLKALNAAQNSQASQLLHSTGGFLIAAEIVDNLTTALDHFRTITHHHRN